ncbi:MAG: hypothetical protein ACFFDI_20360 [Promethearchaeota archaeon]
MRNNQKTNARCIFVIDLGMILVLKPLYQTDDVDSEIQYVRELCI